jgi:predicted RNA-binding Zn ribbon-like protein
MPLVEFPLLGQQVAVDLANTVWVHSGRTVDALSSIAVADRWLAAVATNPLGDGGTLLQAVGDETALRVRDEEFRAALQELRDRVRALLSAAAEGRAPQAANLYALSRIAAAAPSRLIAGPGTTDIRPDVQRRRAGSTASIVLAALAEDALIMAADPNTGTIQSCGSDGCLGLYVRDDPRRRYCSPGCANRARVARHYDRSKASTSRRATQA